MKTVITFGTFDVFHVGHLRLLQRARTLGERLLVGVSSDALNIAKKGRAPVYPQDDRMSIIAGLACVDGVFLEESLEQKAEYLRGKYTTSQIYAKLSNFPAQSSPITKISALYPHRYSAFCASDSSRNTPSTHASPAMIDMRSS